MSQQQAKTQKKLQLVANVKSIPSGDSLVLVHPTKGIEKTVSLSNISAPKMARRDDDKEEPFAFVAREFVRKKCIGKSVEFTFEFQSKTQRDFGTVIVDKENLAISLLREGLAKLKENARLENDNLKPYVEAQDQAKNAKKGVWSDETELQNNTRKIKNKVNADNIAKQNKNKPVTVIVEYLLNGSTYKIQTPQNETLVLNLTGIQCPGFKREGDDKKKKKTQAVVAQPFAKDALAFAESRLLHRDVTVLIEGSERDALFGSIVKGDVQNFDKVQGPVTFQEELLSKGLARLVDWSAAKSQFAARLRAAEQEAKNQKLRIWSNYVAAAPSLQAADKTEFTAKVIEFISGDTLRIRNEKTGQEERISLSSIRAQRLGRKVVDKKDNKKKKNPKKQQAPKKPETTAPSTTTTTTTTTVTETPAPATTATTSTAAPATQKPTDEEKKVTELEFEPFAMEGRELVRSKLLGKVVTVKVDYRREFPSTKKDDKSQTRRFCTVLYDGNKNIALELVKEGYASAIHHKADEERSSAYDQLILAESDAQKQKKGIHGSKKSQASVTFNDLTEKGLGHLKSFLKMLQDKKLKAVVEYVYTANRFKLMLPKDSLFVNFAITGVGVPSLKPEPQPFSKEALAFSHDALLHRDVEVEIVDMDKVGTFIGNVWLSGTNFGESLVKNGFGYLHRMASKLKNYAMLEKLERDAENAKKNIWSNDAFVASIRKPQPEKTSTNKNVRFAIKTDKDKPITIRITDLRPNLRFCYQTADAAANLEKIDSAISVLNLDQQAAPKEVKENDLCLAKYSVDGNWYRGTVLAPGKDNTSFKIKFADFGNVEEVAISSLRTAVPDSLKVVPPQAKEGALAFLKQAPSDYALEAVTFLKEAAEEVVAQFEYVEDRISYFTLFDPSQLDYSLNSQLVQEGLAFAYKPTYLLKNPVFANAITALIDDERVAKSKHYGLWENGDIYGSDEDDA